MRPFGSKLTTRYTKENYCNTMATSDNHSRSHDGADPDHCPLAVQVRLASPFSVYPSLQEYTTDCPKVVPCNITTLPFVKPSSAPQSTTVQWNVV